MDIFLLNSVTKVRTPDKHQKAFLHHSSIEQHLNLSFFVVAHVGFAKNYRAMGPSVGAFNGIKKLN